MNKRTIKNILYYKSPLGRKNEEGGNILIEETPSPAFTSLSHKINDPVLYQKIITDNCSTVIIFTAQKIPGDFIEQNLVPQIV